MKKNTISTTEMHHLFLWIYNWSASDFEKAFKTSPLGWEYQWGKFQQNLSGDTCSSSAIIATILNMDDLHQKLLLDFILDEKYRSSIQKMDENKEFFANYKNWKEV